MRIVVLYPELLGTYGDGGNAKVLAHRARLRGETVEVTEIRLGDRVADADIYLLGGGEDGPQQLATEALRKSADLDQRIRDGAQLLAVCAGYQILGERYAVAGGGEHPGLGLLDVVTSRGEKRRVGDLVTKVHGRDLVGFENHGGVTSIGTEAAFGLVTRGYGNDGATDGVRTSGVFATYAHGPVTALNPWLADEILSSSLGRDLEPVASLADRLHAERVRRLAQTASRRP